MFSVSNGIMFTHFNDNIKFIFRNKNSMSVFLHKGVQMLFCFIMKVE